MDRRLGSSSKHSGLSKAVLRHGFRHGRPRNTENLRSSHQAMRVAAQTQKRRLAIQGKFLRSDNNTS